VPLGEGGGYGRKTVRQTSDQVGIPVETGLQRRRAQGIEAEAGNIREMATRDRKAAFDVAQPIEK